uniref:MFS domain-containing protein n=1 Tax=Meloidogyne hapla TaxID=6305 RepID=A0A1I8AZA2_MELHA
MNPIKEELIEKNVSNNQTLSIKKEQQNDKNEFTAIQRSLLFSGPALGAIIGGFIISPLINLFSVRNTITFFCIISALATLSFPLSEKIFGFWSLCFLRVIQGTCFPAEYVTISIISRKWAPITSTATFLILASTHFQVGPLLTMPTAGYFCESNYGWEGIYYLMSILTLIFTIIFFFIFRGCPSEHPWISEIELKQIEFGKTNLEKERENKNQKPPPYYQILTDWTIWLLLMAFFSDEIAFQFFTEMGPYYLNKVLGITVTGTGLIAALPYLLSLITKLLIGPINDKFLSKIFSEQSRIKLFSGIAQYGVCISMTGLAFIPYLTSSLWFILPFYSTINLFTGLDFLGIFRYSQTIAVKHSEFLLSWLNVVMSSVPLVLPGIIALAAPDDTIKQGTCYPVEYVTISIVSRKWAPITSTATFLILASTHYQVGPLLTMPTAVYFCESNYGWEGIYYLMSILTLIFTIIFFFIFRGCPSEHPWISEIELKQIEFGKIENKNINKNQKPPYYKILTDWNIWLLFLAFFCDEIAFQFIAELGPYYLNKVLCINIAATGFFSALPYLLSIITKVLGGPINDKLLSKIFNEQSKIKIFSAISQYGICISMAGLAIIPLLSSSLWMILPFFAVLNIFTGLNFLGFFRYSQTISGKYSELLISWINIVISIVPLILPGIVAVAAPDDTIKQWTYIFTTISIIVFISITIFILFAKSKPRKWALEINDKIIIAKEKENIEQNK